MKVLVLLSRLHFTARLHLLVFTWARREQSGDLPSYLHLELSQHQLDSLMPNNAHVVIGIDCAATQSARHAPGGN